MSHISSSQIGDDPESGIPSPNGKASPRPETPLRLYYDAVMEQDNKKIEILLAEQTDTDGINSQGHTSWTALHLAAYIQNVEAVRLLCKHCHIDVVIQDDMGDTPLHFAVYTNNTDIVGILLAKAVEKGKLSSLINKENNLGWTPISSAASSYHKTACEMMLAHGRPLDFYIRRKPLSEVRRLTNRNENALKFDKTPPVINYHQKNKYGKSPINILISNLPKVVEQILDNSIMEKKIKDMEEHPNKLGIVSRIILDFGALEEKYRYKDGDLDEKDRYEDGASKEKDRYKPYKDGDYPLQVMVKRNRFDLLTHPVVEALIRERWKSARIYFFGATCLLYGLFFSMLLTFELTQIEPFTTKNGNIIKAWVQNETHTCVDFPEGCITGKTKTSIISGKIVFTMAVMRLMLEMCDFLKHTCWTLKWAHFLKGLKCYVTSPANWLEVLLYSTAVASSANAFSVDVTSSSQWQLGACCVFASFINLLMILRAFPLIGLHIIMFMRIIKTFITQIAVFFLLIIFACAIIFHMVFNQTGQYSGVMILNGSALYQSLAQGVSGVGYDDYEVEGITLYYPYSTALALITFTIFVQILFLNLATGVAIDEIKEIKERSEAEKNALQIEHIYYSRKVLFGFVRPLLDKCSWSYKKISDNPTRFRNMSPKNFNMEKVLAISEHKEFEKCEELIKCEECQKVEVLPEEQNEKSVFTEALLEEIAICEEDECFPNVFKITYEARIKAENSRC